MIAPKNIARQAKLFVDKGLDTQDEAVARLRVLRVVISIDRHTAETSTGQAAFITAIATATRCFVGGVYYHGVVDVPSASPLLVGYATLAEAARAFGAVEDAADLEVPEIIIGTGEASHDLAIRAISKGWVAGCQPPSVPLGHGLTGNAVASIAAAAICVGNVFRFVTGDEQGIYKQEKMSLWSPGDDAEIGPDHTHFIDKLWLAGLGNLGQAFAWVIGALQPTSQRSLQLLLQDFDEISDENWGTSMLADSHSTGELKALVVEDWCRQRGFSTRRSDRRIDETLRLQAGEPLVALSGLDKIEPRRALGTVGFSAIIDVGLGATHSDYTKVRINNFDQQNRPDHHYKDDERKAPDLAPLAELKGYRELDQCGMEDYAGHSIAYTFVSVIAACLAIAQCSRLCLGESVHKSIVVDTADLRTMRVVMGVKPTRPRVGNIALA